jgi:hypothetical protein
MPNGLCDNNGNNIINNNNNNNNNLKIDKPKSESTKG